MHTHRCVAGRQLCASRLRAFLRMLPCRHRYGMLLVALKALARVAAHTVAASIELYELEESCERANGNGRGSGSICFRSACGRRGSALAPIASKAVPSAYVSIRQHTSAYARESAVATIGYAAAPAIGSRVIHMLTDADVC